MHISKRVVAWTLLCGVVVAMGCADPGQRVITLEQQNADLRLQMDKMSTQLAAAAREAQVAQRQADDMTQCLAQHIGEMAEQQMHQETLKRILVEAVAQQGSSEEQELAATCDGTGHIRKACVTDQNRPGSSKLTKKSKIVGRYGQ